jgi:hydroxyacylglutathione hydrolase
VPLVGLETGQRARPRVRRLAPTGDLDGPVEHGHPRVLLHLVVAERLSRLQDNQDGARTLVRMKNDRIARPVWCIHLKKIPALHGSVRLQGAYTLKRSMPLAVDSYVMGPFQSNCYVVRAERGAPEAAIVDPGDDPTPLRLELARMGATAGGILVTHTDVDHVGGVADLADGTGAEVWAPSAEADALRSGMTRGGLPVTPHEPAHLVAGGEQITVAGITFDVVDVPGHSHGHIAFHHDGRLFAGDLLFAGSVGRVDLPGGDWETLLDSIRSLLDRFSPETVVYPGHGPATTLGGELASNPYLSELRAERQS